MDYRELLEKYNLLLHENNRLMEENDRLKAQLGITICSPGTELQNQRRRE